MKAAHEVLSDVFAGDDEPVPGWDQGDPGLIETCRGSIEVEMFGVKKYPDLFSAAAKLFYSTIKTHSFPNANKRYGTVVTMLLLLLHGYRLDIKLGGWAAAAKMVAETDPHEENGRPDVVVTALAMAFRRIGLVESQPSERGTNRGTDLSEP